MVFVRPDEWAGRLPELRAALILASGGTELGQPDERRTSRGVSPVEARLVYTVEEAAKLLGISRSFAYEAVNNGQIPSMRIGRRILVPKAALERVLLTGDPEASSKPPTI